MSETHRAMRSFWAPGRVNLIGEFTDLAGGLVLPAALDLGIVVEAEAADVVELRSLGLPGVARCAADGSTEVAPEGWARYVAAVAAELDALGRPAVGLRGGVRSTLPIGCGLSSSAALEVAVGVALCAVADFALPPIELAQAARRAEHRAVGVPSGIMDQAASVLGRAGCAILLDTATLEHELVPLPPDMALVIVDSGVRRALESSDYATRKRELDEGMPARVRHVVTENERVVAVAEALRNGRVDLLGPLFRAGHESLRLDYEATTLELDRLVDLAYAHGALAARMTGGGFGGAIVVLADAAGAERLADAILAGYGPSGAAYVCRAADGACEL